MKLLGSESAGKKTQQRDGEGTGEKDHTAGLGSRQEIG